MSPCWWITSVNSHIKSFCQRLHIVSDKEFKVTNKFTLQKSDFSRGNCKRPPKSKIVLPANGFVSLYQKLSKNHLCGFLQSLFWDHRYFVNYIHLHLTIQILPLTFNLVRNSWERFKEIYRNGLTEVGCYSWLFACTGHVLTQNWRELSKNAPKRPRKRTKRSKRWKDRGL